jgi:radical SAM-linked protein
VKYIQMTSKDKRTLVVKFEISGCLRFLSHLETMKMFERALKRAGLELCYSAGFNPRPKLSVPLARSVGLVCADDLLYAAVWVDSATVSAVEIKKRIESQLPEGCGILDVEVAEAKTSFTAKWAVYEFPLADCVDGSVLSERVEELVGRIERGEAIVVERKGHKGKASRRVDVSGYIESVECRPSSLAAKCRTTPSGSIRADEILRLLQLEGSSLAGAVVRKSVGWARKQKEIHKGV